MTKPTKIYTVLRTIYYNQASGLVPSVNVEQSFWLEHEAENFVRLAKDKEVADYEIVETDLV